MIDEYTIIIEEFHSNYNNIQYVFRLIKCSNGKYVVERNEEVLMTYRQEQKARQGFEKLRGRSAK